MGDGPRRASSPSRERAAAARCAYVPTVNGRPHARPLARPDAAIRGVSAHPPPASPRVGPHPTIPASRVARAAPGGERASARARDSRRGRSPGVAYMERTDGELAARITARTARVGVIGQGYVGLPLALVFQEAGFAVRGFDVDPAKVAALRRGESYIRHLDPERVARAVASGRLRGDHRLRPARRVRRDPHLRADAARAPPRARQLVHPRDRTRDGATPASGPARGARVHHLSGDHRRGGPADPRGRAASTRPETSSSPSRRSARTPATRGSRPARFPRSSAA